MSSTSKYKSRRSALITLLFFIIYFMFCENIFKTPSPHFTWHISHVTCHFIQCKIKIDKVFGAKWRRFCYKCCQAVNIKCNQKIIFVWIIIFLEKRQIRQYGFRRANTEPSVHFRKANTEPSVHFRRANTETYQKQNVNLSKRVRKDGVFLGLAGLLLRISLRLRPWEIPRSSPASPWKTQSFPPLLLRLTHPLSSSFVLSFSCILFHLLSFSFISQLTTLHFF